MFLSRMVSGLMCSKSHNKNNQTNQSSTKSPKSNKKTEKCKRSLSKTNSKMCISELLKSNVKENHNNKESNTSNNNSNNNNNNNNSNSATSSTNAIHGNGSNNHNNNNNVKSSTSMKPPTKVKSGSWKRSEKQISSYNTIAGKKSKTLRKLSPTWLKFPNSPVKIAEKVAYVGTNDTTSVCRPGTLYSDVLFGAGSSCLVKIKTLTPRRNSNTAQKKLTKALIKCSKSNENEGSASGAETDREVFPSLVEFNKTALNTGKTSVGSGCGSDSGGGVDVGISEDVISTSPNPANGEPSYSITPKSDEVTDEGEPDDTEDSGADVVILSESNGVQNPMNGFDDNTYGSYLENHFKQMNGTDFSQRTSPRPGHQPFTIDIPQWNFMDPDISSEAYPKFLCQFEDEHYLKAEKMALLGLKLALGNNTHQGKFKF